jgi:hypothetical protein
VARSLAAAQLPCVGDDRRTRFAAVLPVGRDRVKLAIVTAHVVASVAASVPVAAVVAAAGTAVRSDAVAA